MKRFGIAVLLAAMCGCTAVDTTRPTPAIVPASKPATAGTAAGSHATKTLSTGPADVGVGRKAFPPPEQQPSKRVAMGPMQPITMGGGGIAQAVDYPPCGAHDCGDGCPFEAIPTTYIGSHDLQFGRQAKHNDDTAPYGTTSHDLQFGRDAKHNDVAEANDADAAYCEVMSRDGIVCIGRAAPPVPATPLSGFGVPTKGPLVTANGRGALGSSTAGWEIDNGDQSGVLIMDGEYNMCLGDHACKDVVHESCVVDVGPPSPLYGRTMTMINVGLEIHILREQNEHCKDGKDRVNLYLDWLFASLRLGNEP